MSRHSESFAVSSVDLLEKRQFVGSGFRRIQCGGEWYLVLLTTGYCETDTTRYLTKPELFSGSIEPGRKRLR